MGHIFFHRGHFLEILISQVPLHELLRRLFFVGCIVLLGGILYSLILKHREELRRLGESENKLKGLVELAPEMMYRMSLPDGTYEYLNPATQEVFGYSASDFLANPLLIKKIIHPDFLDYFEDKWAELMEGNVSPTYEYRIIAPDGFERWIFQSNKGVYDPQGNLIAIEGICRDVTNVKIMEESVREERDLAQKYLRTAGVMFVTLTTDGKVTLINDKGCEILGYDQSEIIGKNWFEYFVPERVREEVKAVFNRLKAGEVELAGYNENSVVTRSGEERLIAWNNIVLTDDSWKISGILSSGMDITERKRAEEQLKTALQEKETLLKEIHHRVKNNLQVVLSLLTLQGQGVRDEKIVAFLRECHGRVKSMALVHEYFHQSGDVAKINVKAYAGKLIDELLRAYGDTGRVRLNLDIRDLSLGMNDAIPSGLIINELVSNSLKYAFPKGRSGRIDISMHHDENDTILLRVADDGIGLPKNMDVNKCQTLGLHLVRIIAQEQLEGGIKWDTNGGTTFEIQFKKKS